MILKDYKNPGQLDLLATSVTAISTHDAVDEGVKEPVVSWRKPRTARGGMKRTTAKVERKTEARE